MELTIKLINIDKRFDDYLKSMSALAIEKFNGKVQIGYELEIDFDLMFISPVNEMMQQFISNATALHSASVTMIDDLNNVRALKKVDPN